MIGPKYWSTGITIEYHGDRWSAQVKFYDDGFCDNESSEGTLRARYQLKDLAKVIDVVKRDAEKLGIQWKEGPGIYVEENGQGDRCSHPGWKAIVKAQCERLGWQTAYLSDEKLKTQAENRAKTLEAFYERLLRERAKRLGVTVEEARASLPKEAPSVTACRELAGMRGESLGEFLAWGLSAIRGPIPESMDGCLYLSDIPTYLADLAVHPESEMVQHVRQCVWCRNLVHIHTTPPEADHDPE